MNPERRNRTPLAMLVMAVPALALLLNLSPAQTYTASPISSGDYSAPPYVFTGMIRAEKGNGSIISSGSGSVVRNARVVFSCAHVVFESEAVDPWLSGVRWYRAWSASRQPLLSEGQPLRGYYYFVGYTAAARERSNSNAAFAVDFVVHYAYENTAGGGFAGFFYDGTSQLTSTRSKLITGYPLV